MIATMNSGSMDIISDPDVGILCERADSGDFARGILQGLSRSWNSEKIVQFAEKYQGENVARHIADVYSNILKGNRNAE